MIQDVEGVVVIIVVVIIVVVIAGVGVGVVETTWFVKLVSFTL